MKWEAWFQFLYQTEEVGSQNFHVLGEHVKRNTNKYLKSIMRKENSEELGGEWFFLFENVENLLMGRVSYLKALHTSDTCIF